MSYSAGSSALSNRVEYPYFYRTYMPDAMLNRARIRIIKDFGWKRVATIHENKDLFSLVGKKNRICVHQNNVLHNSHNSQMY